MAANTTISSQSIKALVPIPLVGMYPCRGRTTNASDIAFYRGSIVPPSKFCLPPWQNFQNLFLKRER